MPNRLISVAILIFWTIAAGALFTRDLLPNYLIGPPPDLRSISQADDSEGPTDWAILAADEAKPPILRAVGRITTETQKKRDGWVRMTSHAWLDSSELLRGSSFDLKQVDRISILGACEIDTSGNLQNFRVGVRLDEPGQPEVLTLEGRLKKDSMEVLTRSPFAILNSTTNIPYQPRSIVQSTLSPLEKMPGLQVGQTWETQMVSPITGAIQKCKVSVVGTEHIVWDNSSCLTLKVVTKMSPFSATTWVRSDGLVLRQEIPTLNRIHLILERIPIDKNVPVPTTSERKRR